MRPSLRTRQPVRQQNPRRCTTAQTGDGHKPNVIFILADDSGFADFGCYGHPYARTPNIDSLAHDGTRFTQFYATGVSCCPAAHGADDEPLAGELCDVSGERWLR